LEEELNKMLEKGEEDLGLLRTTKEEAKTAKDNWATED
jgi:hypothetical protein